MTDQADRPMTVGEYRDRYREALAAIVIEDPLRPVTMDDIGRVAWVAQQFHQSIASRVIDAPAFLKQKPDGTRS